MKETTHSTVGLKPMFSLVVFICFAYVALCNNTGKLLYYGMIAYSLASLYIILPAIWMKDSLQWRMRFQLFIALFCLSWVIAFVMTLLSSSGILVPWLQWLMFGVAFVLVVISSLGYRYNS